MMLQELDATDSREPHFTLCFKCLRTLSKARDIYPDSLMIDKPIVILTDLESGRIVQAFNGGSAVSNRLQTI